MCLVRGSGCRLVRAMHRKGGVRGGGCGRSRRVCFENSVPIRGRCSVVAVVVAAAAAAATGVVIVAAGVAAHVCSRCVWASKSTTYCFVIFFRFLADRLSTQ